MLDCHGAMVDRWKFELYKRIIGIIHLYKSEN